ncbi:hypothetical protein [Candidatus Electrothrix sp.]|uniref:hypothetical protein n=1 Tax=Candidatus Electrothrix sp. TaxID=2170559 RepID=UPI004055C4F1
MTKLKKIGRDATNGQFIPVHEARLRKSEALVETIRPSLMRQGLQKRCLLPKAPPKKQEGVRRSLLPEAPLKKQEGVRRCLPDISAASRRVTVRGRNAIDGRFINVEEANRRKNTSVVETFRLPVRFSDI